MSRASGEGLTRAMPSCTHSSDFTHYCDARNTRGIDVPESDLGWAYFRCKRCQSLLIDRQTDVSHVYENEIPRQQYASPHRFARIKHCLLGHPIERQFGRRDFQGMTVLDIGCGNGAKLFDFYKRGAKVVGLELSDEKLAVARRYMPEGVFVRSTLQDARFPTDSFDIIIADNVLEHIPDADAFVSLVAEHLKSDGQAVFYVPHGHSLSVRMLAERAASIWPPFHLRLFTREYFLVHLPGFKYEFSTRSHFFPLRDAMSQLLHGKLVGLLVAMLLLPVAAEELVVTLRRRRRV